MVHVMTYKELHRLRFGDIVYEEFKEPRNDKLIELQFNGFDFTTNGNAWYDAEHYLLMAECDEEECFDYNWHYRIWNEKPTEDEMNSYPWRNNHYKE